MMHGRPPGRQVGAYKVTTNPPLQETPDQVVHMSATLSHDPIVEPKLLTAFRKVLLIMYCACETVHACFMSLDITKVKQRNALIDGVMKHMQLP